MTRRYFSLTVICVGLLLLAMSAISVSGQEPEDQFETSPIRTNATDAVGIGSYVAGQAYAVPAGEDPAEQPVQAIILPYGIYPDMHVDMIEDFEQPAPTVEGFTFEWSFLAEDGSEAELIDGNVAIFLADIEGVYELTLTATDENGNVGESTWVVYATTYVGSGYLRSANEDDPTQCIDCHEEVVDAWSVTGHASTYQEALDGQLSDHFNADCTLCHATGFDNREGAVNGGMDDVISDTGWVFPENLVEGNWDQLLTDFPEVAEMSNVQCEACHGPGSAHIYLASRRESMIGTGLSYGSCAQCHASEPYHLIPQQWESSAHAEVNARAFTYPIGEDRASCVRCHSGVGYIDWANGVPEEEQRTDYQVHTCAVCHDPHDSDSPNQLRVFDTVTLPDGTEIDDAGPSATCMSCHNARRDPISGVEGAVESGRISTPHYSTGAELMNATGGYTWGFDMPTSGHGEAIEDSCVACHMANTPPSGTVAHNEIGGHTFAMTNADGIQNITTCEGCHDGEDSFNFEAFRDYDGDGTIETNDEEVAGLRELLVEALAERGVSVLDHYPYYEIAEGTETSVDLYGAIWNHKFTESGGSAVHNLRYTVALLQLSYEQLLGEPVPNAYILEASIPVAEETGG